MGLSILIIIVAGAAIYFAGDKFAEQSSLLGDRLGLPRSVKGATFDAISSSMPELLAALFAVITFEQFDVALGTITGSALFNLLVIPALSLLFGPKVLKVAKEVVHRDGIFYVLSVVILLIAVAYFHEWNIGIALFFILAYLAYIFRMYRDTDRHYLLQKKGIVKATPIPKNSLTSILVWLGVTLLIMTAAMYFLLEHALSMAHILNIAPALVGFTVVAIATSLSDTVVSVVNARKGDTTDAVSNIFGSNSFDILVGLSLPVLFATIWSPVYIDQSYFGIILALLLVTSLIVFWLYKNDYKLDRKEAALMFVIYIGFVWYVAQRG